MSPTMVASLKTWGILLNLSQKHPPTSSFPLPLTSLVTIISDLNVKHWKDKGIINHTDLMIGPSRKTFRSLQVEFGLEGADYYTFIRISHFLKTNPPLSFQLPWKIALYLTKHFTNIKGISLFYNTISEKQMFSRSSNIVAWERDLGISYSSEQW